MTDEEVENMECKLAQKLKLKYFPAAIILSNEKPAEAMEFIAGRWGCSGAMLSAVVKGRRAVFSSDNFGCEGGGVGLGFLNQFSAGMEHFLANSTPDKMPPKYKNRQSEGYKKTAALTREWMDNMARVDFSEKYVIFKPLHEVDTAAETPQSVVFYVNPDQLTALIVLANYESPTNDRVIAPFASGCQSVCRLSLIEGRSERPRAVIGMTDISVRLYMEPDMLAFSMPFALFKEMEANADGSFLDRELWHKIVSRFTVKQV